MPLYDFSCDSCNYENEFFLSINDSLPRCPQCSGAMHKLYKNLHIGIDQTLGHYDSGLGCVVSSSSHRRQIMKQRGLVDMSTSDISKYIPKQHDDAVLDRKRSTDATVKKIMVDAHNKLKTVNVSV